MHSQIDGFDMTNMMLLFSNIGNSSSFIPLLIIIGKLLAFLYKQRYEISYIFSSYNVEYVIESHIVPIIHFNMRYDKPTYKLKFSKDFKAIIHYINTHMNDIHFTCIHEILETNNELADRTKDKKKKKK